jgi:hypothetical protein
VHLFRLDVIDVEHRSTVDLDRVALEVDGPRRRVALRV